MSSILLALAAASLLSASEPAPASSLARDDVRFLRARKEEALSRLTERFESLIPPEAYHSDGSPNLNHPEYQKAKERWEKSMEAAHDRYDRLDPRLKEIPQVPKGEAVAPGIINSGGPIKKLGSDMDLTAESEAAGRAFVNDLKNKKPGLEVVEDSLAWRIPEKDLVVWKTPKAKNAAGSCAQLAEYQQKAKPHADTFPTAGGMHSTSGGKLGVDDPKGAVLSNAIKASDAGIMGDPGKADLQMVGKSVSKAAEAAGTKSPTPFYEKAEKVRSRLTPEQAGVTTFGAKPERKKIERESFVNQARDEIEKAYENASRKSAQLDERRSRQAAELLEAGDKAGHARVREEQIGARVSNEATLHEMSKDNPAMVKKLTGQDPKTLPGQEHFIGESAKLTKIVEETHQPKPAPDIPVPPSIGVADAAKKWGYRALDGLDIIGSGIGGAEAELEEAIRQGRSPSKVRAVQKAVGETLWQMTGIPLVAGAASRAKEVVNEELAKDDAQWGDRHWGIAARVRTAIRLGKDLAGIDGNTLIAEEEIRREEDAAHREGRQPSYARSTINGLARGIGGLIGIARIAEFSSRDWPAEAANAMEGRYQRHWAQARAEESLSKIKGLIGELREAAASLDPANPASRETISRLAARYGDARQALARIGQFSREQFGADDEMTRLIYGTASSLPKPEAFTDALKDFLPSKTRPSETEIGELVHGAEQPPKRQEPSASWAAGRVETVAEERSQPPPAAPEPELPAELPPPAPVAQEAEGSDGGQPAFDPAPLIGAMAAIYNQAAGKGAPSTNDGGGGASQPAAPARNSPVAANQHECPGSVGGKFTLLGVYHYTTFTAADGRNVVSTEGHPPVSGTRQLHQILCRYKSESGYTSDMNGYWIDPQTSYMSSTRGPGGAYQLKSDRTMSWVEMGLASNNRLAPDVWQPVARDFLRWFEDRGKPYP
ncbi:MAG: hypothetical protein AAB036_08720 [Elusimicrobiota bacterium]|mgnify:FL=1